MEQVNDVLDGLVGFVISGFQLAVGPVGGSGLWWKRLLARRSAEALVEEQEQEGDVNAFGGQAVGVAAAIALEQPVPFELARDRNGVGLVRRFWGKAGTW